MDYEMLRSFRNDRNPFSARLGIYVEELRPGSVPHGGVYFSLADTACGSAMAAYGTMAVTINCSFSFLKSARVGDKLTAEARELPGGRSVCVLEARVTGEAGELFALGTFTFRRLDKPIGL